MKIVISVGLVSLYGLFVRLTFGLLQSFMGVMSVAFLAIAPLVIGFLTIYFLPLKKIKSSGAAFFIPTLTCLAILGITLLFSIEGIICWIMIFPIFAILAGLGGLISYRIKKKNTMEDADDLKDFLKDLNKPKISLILMIPIFIGALEGDRLLSRKDFHLQEKIIINAPKEAIWKHITSVGEIDQKEAGHSLSDIIGFPRHTKTLTTSLAVGGKRKAIYEKGLFFDEVIKEIEPYKKLRLDVITQPEKVPPTVMDEHIVIGGAYVDILEDEYLITAIGTHQYEVRLSSHFFINTPFNWYTGIWSDYLMRDILQKELERIKARAEKKS